MGIRRWFDRIRKTLIWGLGIGLLVLGTLTALLLFTPMADHIGRIWLIRFLREEGIALRVGEVNGSLARGLEVRELSVEKPGQWSLTASRVRLELSIWSVLRGRPQFKEVILEDAQVLLRVDALKGEGRRRGGGLPRLGISRWVLRRASLRLLKEGEALPWVGGWSRLDGEGGLSMGATGLRVSARSLETVSTDPRLPPLQASGTVSWAGGSGIALDLSAVSGGSHATVRGRFSGRGAERLWKGRLEAQEFDLALLAPLWPGAPARRASADLEVEVSAGRALWEGTVEVAGSGRAEGKGEYLKVSTGHSVRGMAQVEAFSLGTPPLLPALDPLAPSGSGRVTYVVDVTTGGPPALRLDLDTGAASLYGLALSRAVGTVSWSAGALQVRAQGASPLAETVQVEVERNPGGTLVLRAQGEGVRVEPLLKGLGVWRNPPAPLRLPADPWNAVVLSMQLRDGGGLTLSASGGCPVAERVELDLEAPPGGTGAAWEVEARGLDPRPFGLDAEGTLNGTLSFKPQGGGRGTYRAVMGRSRFVGVDVEPFEATVHQGDGAYRLEPSKIQTSEGGGTLALTWWDGGRMEGSVALAMPDAQKAATLFGKKAPAGPVEGTVNFRREAGRWSLQGKARMESARWGTATGRGVGIEGRWAHPVGGGDATLSWEDLTVGSQRLGPGNLRLRGGDDVVRLDLEAALGTGKDVEVRGEGILRPESMDLRLSEGRLRLPNVETAQEGAAHFVLGPAGLTLESLSLRGPSGAATLDLRLGGGEPGAPVVTSGALRLDQFSLAALPVPATAGAISGRVSGDLRWCGTLQNPGLEGGVRVEEGAYRFARSDLVWTPVALEFAARGDRFELVRGSATSPEGGQASATGWVRLENLWPVAFRLDASGKAMPFVLGTEVEGAADFAVTLSGTPKAPEIGGRALVVKGRILLPDIARQAPLPQTVTFTHAPAGSPFAPLPDPEEAVVGRLRGAVELESQRGLWVSNRNLLAELTGIVRAEFTDEGVVLRGGLQLGQGRYLFQGKTFEITSARILFNREGTVLDVAALYVASDGTEVTVRLFGPAERPQVRLTSRPPLDSSGILSVLLYDHRPEELSEKERQGWAAAAAVIALQYQSGDLLESVRERTGLDAITVVTGDTGESAGVGLTKSLGDKVVVQYQQLFGTVPEERVNIRYRINRRLSFRGTTSSVDGTTADLLWEKRY